MAVAEEAGIGVCIDLHACWTESGLRQSIARAVPLSAMVQISDYVPGNETMDRAEPGAGMIPLGGCSAGRGRPASTAGGTSSCAG